MKRCIIVGAGEFYGLPFLPDEADMLIAADGGYGHLSALGLTPQLIVGDLDSLSVGEMSSAIPGEAGVSSAGKWNPPAAGETGSAIPGEADLPGVGEADVPAEGGRNSLTVGNMAAQPGGTGIDIYADAEAAGYLTHAECRRFEGIELRVLSPIKNDPDLLACMRIGLAEGFREFHLLGGLGGRIDHSYANQQLLLFAAERGARAYLYGERQLMTVLRDGVQHFPEGMRGYISVFAVSERAEGVSERGLKYVLNDAVLSPSLPLGLSNEFTGAAAEISVKRGSLMLVYEFQTEGERAEPKARR